MIYDRYYNFHVTPWNIITNIQTSRFVKAMTITYCTCLYFHQPESFISKMFIWSSYFVRQFVWNNKHYTIDVTSTDMISQFRNDSIDSFEILSIHSNLHKYIFHGNCFAYNLVLPTSSFKLGVCTKNFIQFWH